MAVAEGLQAHAFTSTKRVDSKPDAAAMEHMSYAQQYDHLVAQPKGSINFKKPCKKPSLDVQVSNQDFGTTRLWNAPHTKCSFQCHTLRLASFPSVACRDLALAEQQLY